ncbi:MAG: YgiQ family radical SAM protein [Clostridia bacterium]|nr:YgiQ family radical SAM protein [Clostridia bacterium]
MNHELLPINRAEMEARGWDYPDFVLVTGDAYVDHPSFGTAIISRVLENAGFRVAILPQPDWHSTDAFTEFGCPRLGFLINAGNIDSMVAHYSASKHKRNYDYYSPGGKTGLRPDRACIVYANRVREAYPDMPILIGGLEASLRRLAHYDYWDNKVRRSILLDARADLLMYGMGEKSVLRIAELLDRGIPVQKIRDVRGTVYAAPVNNRVHYPVAATYDFDALSTDKRLYAEAFGVQYRNTDAVTGKAIIELYGDRAVVQNPPMPPLEREELDAVYALPYTRRYHPSYDKVGGVPSIQEVEFSVTHNRGCFGACNFCALAFHQGRTVRSRSIESVVREVEELTQMPGFKGYIHDVGGPTANFRYPACEKQLKHGVCPDRKCLAPTPCKNLKADHTEYVKLLKAIEKVPGVKKVFIRSGVRFDYVLADKDETFFKKLVRDHVSGQLKVAPEHCVDGVLGCMGKPPIATYDRFRKRFFELTKSFAKEQYLVPYLISSHPGSTLADAVELASWLRRNGLNPEQVQDFYPTPGTASTAMYYTGINPLTMKPVYVATDEKEKRMQRALLQTVRPENAGIIREALRKVGREDLIGFGTECLVKPEWKERAEQRQAARDAKSGGEAAGKGRSGGKQNRQPAKNAAKFSGKPGNPGKNEGNPTANGKNQPKTARPSDAPISKRLSKSLDRDYERLMGKTDKRRR